MSIFSMANVSFKNASGAQLNEMFFADMNGDGHLDAVLAYQLLPLENKALPIKIMFGNGHGGFVDGTNDLFPNGAPTTVAPRDHIVADLNGDGRLDLYFADQGYDANPFPGFRNTLALSKGGVLSDATAASPQRSDFTHSVASADIDGDGDIDLFVGNIFGGQHIGSYFLINDGKGAFTVDENRPTSLSNLDAGVYTSSTFLDVNGDGRPDLFLGSDGHRASSLSDVTTSKIYINDGTGHFSDQGATVSGMGENNIIVSSASADINGDGRADLVVSVALNNYSGPGAIHILLNDGHGNFVDDTANRLFGFDGAPQTSSNWIYRAPLVDVDGDGSLDIVLTSGGSTTQSPVFLNDGTGHFLRMSGLLADLDPADKFSVADVNEDGRADFVSWRTDYSGNENLRVYAGQTPSSVQSGTANSDGLMGGSTADTIMGALGNDSISGGLGDDYLRGDEGNDIIIGGAGFDDINGNMGNDTASGGLGPDWVVGGKDNDLLRGDEGDDIVYGNLGNDTLDGGTGADIVRGGQGDDIIYGGSGNDWMSGDRGNDTIYGGTGADTFHTFSGAGMDRVMDFNFKEGDHVVLDVGTTYTTSQVGADTVIDMGNGDSMVLVGVDLSSLSGGWISY